MSGSLGGCFRTGIVFLLPKIRTTAEALVCAVSDLSGKLFPGRCTAYPVDSWLVRDYFRITTSLPSILIFPSAISSASVRANEGRATPRMKATSCWLRIRLWICR